MRTTSRRKRQPALTPDASREQLPGAGQAETPLTTPLASGQTDTPEKTVDRLSVPLTESGAIDLDSLRATTKEKLKAALSDPTLAQRLGVIPISGASTTLFDPMVCGILYDAVGQLLVVGAIRSGYPPAEALTLMFSPPEKEALAPLTGRVLDKWLPTSGKYQDEAMLALSLFGILSGKLAGMKRPGTVLKIVPDAPAQ